MQKKVAKSAKNLLTLVRPRANIQSDKSRIACDNSKGGEIMNVNKLKGKIVEKDMTVERLAALIGINRASLYRKLNNCEKITIGEAIKIKEVLEMNNEEAFEIFLS